MEKYKVKKSTLTWAFFLININISCFSNEINDTSCNFSSIQSENLTFANQATNDSYFYGWTTSPMVADDNGLLVNDFEGKHVKLLRNEELIPDTSASSSHYFRKAIVEDCRVVYARFYADGAENFSGIITKEELKEQAETAKIQARALATAKSYIGKSFWVNFGNYPLREIYAESGQSIYNLKKFEKFTVKDVFTGTISGDSSGVSIYLKVITEDKIIGLFPFNESYILKNNPLSSKRPARIINAMKQEKVVLGMTRDEAKLSWGEPNDINRTVGSWGVHEQWVYGSIYLYFKNGILTSFQD